MSWRLQKDHDNDFYFCCSHVKGIHPKRRKTVQYAYVESVTLAEGNESRIPCFPDKSIVFFILE